MVAFGERTDELTVRLFGAFHHVNSSNPRYKLNTDYGRYETMDESVSPNDFVTLNENGEPEWNKSDCDVILTRNVHGQVIAIREWTD